MAVAYVSLGSNLGNRRHQIIIAAAKVAERMGDMEILSGIYETDPWGFVSDYKFLNAAAKISTTLSPEALLKEAKGIEKEMGRVARSIGGAYEDRPIDIDLLIYDNDVIRTDSLVIPHPQLASRRFVLEPLAEIAPFLSVPGEEKKVSELLAALMERESATEKQH